MPVYTCYKCGCEVGDTYVKDAKNPLCPECDKKAHGTEPIWRLWRMHEELKKRVEELEKRNGR